MRRRGIKLTARFSDGKTRCITTDKGFEYAWRVTGTHNGHPVALFGWARNESVATKAAEAYAGVTPHFTVATIEVVAASIRHE